MLRISKRMRQTILALAGVCIVGYFVYHTLQGERGWFAMTRMEREVGNAQATLEQLQKDRKELQHRTQLMRPNNLDPDLLEEKSRELLNYSKPNEIVVLIPREDQRRDDKDSDAVLLQRNK